MTSVAELYSQLVTYETHMALQSGSGGGSSTNLSNRGGGGGRGRGDRDGFTNNNPGRSDSHNSGGRDNSRPTCQVYKNVKHTADQCWHRFDEEYMPEDWHVVVAATHSFNDNNWYTDLGATDHITRDLEKLAICDKYTGNDQIHTASGRDMAINHIGYSTIHTLCSQLMLNKILHVPQALKNLISVHRLASDNNIFLEFHPRFFCIKDLYTRSLLVKGPCQGGLYPLPSSSFKKLAFGVNKLACGVIKPSIDRWHSRLGQPATSIVQRVIKEFNLPCLVSKQTDSVCNACKQAKSYHLPYPKSTSTSSHPLELVFSDVWGATPESVGCFKYYVSFIDDYSKFT
jgi:hypothetical protein